MHFEQLFKKYRKINLPIKGKNYRLAVADTNEKRKIGLSQVKRLPAKCGMIFVYDRPVRNAFTMQKTSIPLTVIFLDKSLNIVDVFKGRPYQKKSIQPSSDYSFVVEIWFFQIKV